MKKTYLVGALFLLVVIGVVIFLTSKKPSIIPSVSAQDQVDINGEVTIQEVVAAKPSWLVIQTNEDGVPGPVIGYIKINAGINKDVKVKIDKSKATPSLHAMIHEDNGTKDKFDFPENDLPIMYKMEMVTKIFKLN